MANNRGSVTTESQTKPGVTDEEIRNAWYSLGFRGVVTDWELKYKFAKEIEKIVKQNLRNI